jgi:hypothetical protein
MAQTASQAAVCAKGLNVFNMAKIFIFHLIYTALSEPY